MAMDASSLYVTGFDNSLGTSNSQLRIEKRNKVTGVLVSVFDTDGVVLSNPSTRGDSANAIIVDPSYLYVAGGDYALGAGNQQWRIEKRIIFTGGF